MSGGSAGARVTLAISLAIIPLLLGGCGSGGAGSGGDDPSMTTTMTTTRPAVNPVGCGDHCTECGQDHWCNKCEKGFQLTGPSAQCLFECASDLKAGTIANVSQKGLCLDDTTFLHCPSQLPRVWPNTNEPIQSIRMFKSWGFGDGWDETKRVAAWDSLKTYVDSAGDRRGIWQVELPNKQTKSGEWTPFDSQTQGKIAVAEAKGQTSIKWHHGTQDYIIDLKNEVQTNIVTNTTHPLRHVDGGAVKVLVGTQITCNETEDDKDWENVKLFLKHLGAGSVMGVAVGNELELLSTKQPPPPPGCIENLWKGNYLWKKFQSRFDDLQQMDGFKLLPITSIFGGFALSGNPIIDTPQAGVLTFMKKVLDNEDMSALWVFSFNFYPYFDPNFALDPGTTDKCSQSIKRAVCWDSNTCNVPGTTSSARSKMKQLTGNDDDVLWLGETGWSSPQAATLTGRMAKCPDWSSKETFTSFYEGFLKWDLSMESVRPPDHVFFFTMRDSINFGDVEHFGLVDTCSSTTCKLTPNASDEGSSITV